MADEATPPAEQPPVAAPSWVANTQAIIKMLAEGQQPQRSAQGASLPADQLNPWLKALEAATGTTNTPAPPMSSGQAPAEPMQPQQISAPAQKAAPHAMPAFTSTPYGQIPVSTVMQMQQHQVTPAVEAAKQRVLQALLQRPHGVVPQAPAKG